MLALPVPGYSGWVVAKGIFSQSENNMTPDPTPFHHLSPLNSNEIVLTQAYRLILSWRLKSGEEHLPDAPASELSGA